MTKDWPMGVDRRQYYRNRLLDKIDVQVAGDVDADFEDIFPRKNISKSKTEKGRRKG
ncbi:MAG: hypothetical protein LIP02_09760 [Bacteroidales bacterium]|nr:hypothetical protein [Bacteroidales bacterium]